MKVPPLPLLRLQPQMSQGQALPHLASSPENTLALESEDSSCQPRQLCVVGLASCVCCDLEACFIYSRQKSLSVVCITNIFLHSTACLFILLSVFNEQNLNILMKSNLSIYFMVLFCVFFLRNVCLYQGQEDIPLCFLLGDFSFQLLYLNLGPPHCCGGALCPAVRSCDSMRLPPSRGQHWALKICKEELDTVASS